MATAHFSGLDHIETHPVTAEDGICVTSAMFGGACGALGGVAVAGGTFEYAAVLVGTLGVMLGSIIAGTAGRYLVLPLWTALSGRPSH
jgi:hypothetical protein